MKIYTGNESAGWNEFVKSFSKWDVYYLYEYAHSFELHGDGEPLLLTYEDSDCRFCYVVMKQDISDSPLFSGLIEKGKYFDFETPYGYGGALTDATIPESSQKAFLCEMMEYCKKEGIVSQFLRFHPLLSNHDSLNAITDERYLRDTIYIDTESPELIMANMDSKNRNMVRKAIKNGVTVEVRDITDFDEFLDMYIETMKNNDAEEYYTFQRNYFESLSTMHENACIFYAMYEEKPISAAIMYYNENFMHYHLSGTHWAYRNVAPGNLLLYKAGCWASEHGISKFHLGGGMAPEDTLFGFKKQFNKNGRLPFYVGRTIFDEESYNYLLKVRKKANPEFDMDNGFMIQYRRP